MGTKRAAGTQHTAKGPVQGNSLVDPTTGQPVSVIDDNGIKRLAVDANFTAQTVQATVELDAADDSVRVEDPNTGAHIRVEPDGSVNVNTSIDSSTGDNIAIKDSDGHELNVNPDGSINVVAASSSLTTPTIDNIDIPTPNVETTYSLPANTKKFLLKARGNSKIQLAYSSGQSDTNYVTIHPGNSHEEIGFNTAPTLYFRTSKTEVVEILSWV